MNFDWTRDQVEIYERTLDFARTSIGRHLGSEAQGYSRDAWRACGDFGLLGLSVPQRYGGQGLDAVTTARVLEAFGRGCRDVGLGFSVAAHLLACAMPIVEAGPDSVKSELLPAMCAGDAVGANAITEPEAGSDVFALQGRAERIDDAYVLNATKSFVTNGPVADILLGYFSTNPAHGHLGISAFVIDARSDGITLGKPYEKIGLRTSPTGSVYFEDCRVPEARRLGVEGQGSHVFNASMRWERACLFALYLGLMERQLESAIRYARERRQAKKRISRFQAVSHRIVNMKLRLESVRWLVYRACWCLDQGKDSTLAASIAKVSVSEAAIQQGLDAVQVHGGLGVMEEGGVERGLRDAIPSTIFSGTSEVQRNLIARLLGL